MLDHRRLHRPGAALLLASLVVTGSAWAQSSPPTPMLAAGVEIVSAHQAERLIGRAAFFDLDAATQGKGRIKGAVPLPFEHRSELATNFDASKDRLDVSRLPQDKSQAIVFYGDGPAGWTSYKAARIATQAGYKNVKWMREGVTGWKAKGLPLESL